MRVLLADDRARVRSALRVLLEQLVGIEVVGEAAEVKGLLTQVKMTSPNLVLLDWELPGLRRNGALSTLRQLGPDLCVIALSGRPESRHAALAAGVDAFVSKGDPPERLLDAIEGCGN
jgi:DNA-binding NarL/FixJ family response regulator